MLRSTAVLLVVLTLAPAAADELDALDALSQAEFERLASDLAGVLSYKALQPAEPYGSIGFDVGIDAGAVRIDNEAVWAAAGVDASTVPYVGVSVTKGLPFNVDVGGFVSTAPGSGLRNYGAQLRYALVEGGIAMPAIGLRAAVTRLDGVDQLDVQTRSLDVSVSKGFGPFTPYAGYGRVWASANPHAATGLDDVDVSENRAFAGARISLVALQFALEAERTGDTSGYSLKLGFGF